MNPFSLAERKLKPIELSDREVFAKAYGGLSMPLADQSFEMMYIWSSALGMRWAEINGNICVFARFEGSYVIWGPVIGGGSLQQSMDEAFLILDRLNRNDAGKGRLCYLPAELEPVYSSLSGYRTVHQNQDYVYLSSELAGLEGGAYRKKRNMINRFLSENRPVVEEFSDSKHLDGCLEILELWRRQKLDAIGDRDDVRFQFDTEFRIAEDTVRLAGALKLRGMVVIIGGKIQGMTFGHALTREMCSIIVEKTNLNIKGLSEYIYREFVRSFWSGCRYVNAQEDMGVDYLRAAKESYHPVMLLKSFSVVRK
ncbi:DUF2156 domain-containing protein [Candidatus Woesearchaeota archaeon]|nr:DUF2156 domain-containing protein [Candidatus Woesearchaeota archaeon]